MSSRIPPACGTCVMVLLSTGGTGTKARLVRVLTCRSCVPRKDTTSVRLHLSRITQACKDRPPVRVALDDVPYDSDVLMTPAPCKH